VLVLLVHLVQEGTIGLLHIALADIGVRLPQDNNSIYEWASCSPRGTRATLEVPISNKAAADLRNCRRANFRD
jgi:hypothetical protein